MPRNSKLPSLAVVSLLLGACAGPSRASAPPSATWEAAPILGVRDVRAALHYYTRVLGFRAVLFVDGVDANEGGVYAIVERSQARLHLQARRSEAPQPRDSIASDAYVSVADVDALFDECSRKGVRLVRPLQQDGDARRDFTIEDPDGNRVVFGSEVSK